MSKHSSVDADFLALPLEATSDAAIATAQSLGASHVDVRIEKTRTGLLQLRDAKPESQSDDSVVGLGVRVIVNGAWGFASSPSISVSKAQELARIAVAMAKYFEVHLVYTFEKTGVLSDFNDENSAIPLLNYSLYQQLKQEEKIFAGMLPKLDNAYAAISGGVASVRIGDAKDLKHLVIGTSGTSLIYD